jgi:hypothetical protein
MKWVAAAGILVCLSAGTPGNDIYLNHPKETWING